MFSFINKRLQFENETRKRNEIQKIINKRKEEIQNINKLNNSKFQIKEKDNSVIPLNLYTCWHTKDLPPLMKQNYEKFKNDNPEFNHYLYDENECIEFIKQNFDEKVLNAYNSLIPCAYKADLWRYCVLYINGGIYLDIKFKCMNGFKFIYLTGKEHFVRDRPEDCVLNGLIIALPKNEILLKCINQIVENVKNRYYGNDWLYPTGPGLLGHFFSTDEIKKLELYFTSNIKDNIENCYIVYKDTKILDCYPEYRKEQSKNQKNKHYGDLWIEKNIYNKIDKPFVIKDNYDSIIPLNLFACWHTKDLPPLMKQNYEKLKSDNPEFNHYLYDENECIEFIKQNFDENVLNAYNSLVPLAYKADLWRYCVLYINGGVYLDIKFKCVNSFKLISLTEKEHFVRDRPEDCILNGLIVALPKNEILLKCINQIVVNVKNRYYGKNCLHPTGPGLLGRFLSADKRNNLELYFTSIIQEHILSSAFIVYKDSKILDYYPKYREEQSKNQKNKPYYILWDEKNIYY
jgi:mannosyltransferase OCH1-like enzyme